ncbi:MAG: SRPBCC domain-containing protein, partial [Anaerolineae bacterium]|nr:SRPBCC domain-containing protein [Anaerolineae bacterium]
MKRDLKFERFYPHPPERVWKALTDPAALASWYMANDFKLEVGHKFTFHTDPGPRGQVD